ncbi:SAM-dependent methyltransferase [Hyphomonas sp. WL0036]|uniref:class I SAM-dependent methyltransferase n=1 Tax=Hyphomonas sediminis TaxID=2866160 RepID=UPI001C7F8553|nr:SAM-dependent methyltransferase [Hyphomonas sediminis]MBY9067365.1 SAM-dependent methyltransferase [Hyphomonas sediminis]
MTLEERLIRLIETEGPIPLSTYMQIALHDPKQGYYAARPGIGRDFTTAPETSQVFGELIGLWLVHEWRAMGEPAAFRLVEIGPGRALLLHDALKIASLAGGEAFLKAAQLTLVEPSPALRLVQKERLARFNPSFARQLSDVPPGPMLLVANEYLDCLPARQFRRDGERWRECVIGLSPERSLVMGLAADEPRPPAGATLTGDVVEVQTGLDLVVADLASRKEPFRALFIDYGPADRAPGDTLRAFRKGQQVSPLAEPGANDLTVDVDFGRFARLAASASLDAHGPAPQGMFLLGLGAQARLNQLIKANPDQAEEIFNAAQRLIDPQHMGERFKAICLSSSGLPKPAGF